MAPVKKSFAHNYFMESPDGLRVICNICNGSLKIRSDGSTCHMNRHIQQKHPGVLDLPPGLGYSACFDSDFTQLIFRQR